MEYSPIISIVDVIAVEPARLPRNDWRPRERRKDVAAYGLKDNLDSQEWAFLFVIHIGGDRGSQYFLPPRGSS